MNYDLIGDIHGHGEQLHRLLHQLGYRERGGSWRQSGHQAIFLGDYIDRGSQQLETVATVRAMVEAGSALAVMGNHEFNAIAWSLPDPERPGQYLRPHTEAKRRQHEAFLAATDGKPALRTEIRAWFLQLPLWLELPELRVVHACWDEASMDVLKPHLDDRNRIDVDGVRATSRCGSAEYRALERVLKGPEIPLPDGISFVQGDSTRTEARIRWWLPAGSDLRSAAIVDRATVPKLPQVALAAENWPRHDLHSPIFIGHYWMQGVPAPLTPMIACLDYSVGRGGPLVAYRWRGEQGIDPTHFVQMH